MAAVFSTTMDRFVSVPREALAELLKASGSPLTPEQYLAALPEFGEFKKYAGRAKAAIWSKNILLIAAILSVGFTCLPFGFGFESVLVSVILVVLTYFEYRVYYGFRDRNPEAPMLGFRNQSAFAAFILIYGLYHAFMPMEIPAGYREVMDPDLTSIVQGLTKVAYLAIGIIGGLSQFGYAWYYRAARVRG